MALLTSLGIGLGPARGIFRLAFHIKSSWR